MGTASCSWMRICGSGSPIALREIWMPEDFFRNCPSLRQDMEYTRGQGLYQVRDDEWQEYVAGRIEAIRKGNIPPQELRLANGKVLQYECVALPDGGRMLTYFDITELTRIQEALRASVERYDLAMQGSNEALWDWDAANDVIYISPRFKAFLGLPPAASGLTPAEWRGLVHPEDVEQHDRAITAHLRGETAFFSLECRVRRPDGSYVWIQNRGLGVRDATGRVYRMAGSIGDISPLKQREGDLAEALRAKEAVLQELQAVLDNIEYGLLFMDADLRPRVANRALYRMWRVPESILTERPSWREMVEYARDMGVYQAPPSGDAWEAWLAVREERIRAADPRAGRAAACGRHYPPAPLHRAARRRAHAHLLRHHPSSSISSRRSRKASSATTLRCAARTTGYGTGTSAPTSCISRRASGS